MIRYSLFCVRLELYTDWTLESISFGKSQNDILSIFLKKFNIVI